MPSPSTQPWWVYLLRCGGGRYYVGISQDVAQRVLQHRKGRGARFTRTRRVERLVGAKEVGTRAQAMQLERRLKQMPLARKLAFFGTSPDPDEYRSRKRTHAVPSVAASVLVARSLDDDVG